MNSWTIPSRITPFTLSVCTPSACLPIRPDRSHGAQGAEGTDEVVGFEQGIGVHAYWNVTSAGMPGLSWPWGSRTVSLMA